MNTKNTNKWLFYLILDIEVLLYFVLQFIVIDECGIEISIINFYISAEEVKAISVIVSYTCSILFLLFYSRYLDCRRLEKLRQSAPYGFIEPDEYLSYISVGRKSKKIPDIDVKVFYSDWYKYIREKYKNCDINFVKYLTRECRNDTFFLDSIKTLLIPALIGFVAIYCDDMSGMYSMIVGLACIVSVIVLCGKEMVETDNRINMYTDVIEIVNQIINERTLESEKKHSNVV